ncbi:MAG: hypothetical protein IPN76_25420 [Saprospiraceae bacterium]|nr:hypothetical protein [Saprospiraceae bacterium]
MRLYRLERLKNMRPIPDYLNGRQNCSGPEHYMYPTLHGRKCYFEGQVLQMESPVNADLVLGKRLLDKYRESLRWQPDAAATYLAIMGVFVRIMPQADSMLWYGQKAIERAPTWIRAYTVTAIDLTERFRRFDDSKQLLDQALSVDSNSAEAWAFLGAWESQKGNELAIEPYLLKSIALDSTYHWAYFRLGALYFDQNKMSKARRYLLKAAQADKPGAQVFDYLGKLHHDFGQFDLAEKYFNEGLVIEPNSIQCMIHLASVYFKTEQTEKANLLLQRAMKYDSTSAFSMLLICDILADNGYYKEAETFAQKAISRDSLATWGLSYVYLKSGRFEEASQLLRSQIAIFPYEASFRDFLAKAYQYSGKNEEAFNTYSELLKINPESPYGYIGMASLSAAEGKAAEALGYIEQAIQKEYSFEQLQTGKDLASLRELPEWKDLMKKHFPTIPKTKTHENEIPPCPHRPAHRLLPSRKHPRPSH